MDRDFPSQGYFYNKSAEQLCELLSFNNEDLAWMDDLTTEDWRNISVNAIGFEMASLLYLRLKKLNYFDRLDPQMVAELRDFYHTAGMKGLLRKHDFQKILTILNRNEIPSVILKGCQLVEEIYRDPALRSMVDIDILVPKESLDRAAASIMELGYQPYKTYSTVFEISRSHQLPIFLNPGHHPVELHWNIISPELPYNIDLAGLWERKRHMIIGGTGAWALSKEDTILHMAVHTISQHRLTGGLRLIFDFASVLFAYENDINWPLLIERSRIWRASSVLFLLLIMSQHLFKIGAPLEVLQQIQPGNYDKSWEETARDLVFINPMIHPGFSRNLAAFLSTNSLTGKLRLGLKRVFPNPEEIARILSTNPKNSLSWLYYPSYIKYLFKRHHKSMLKIAGGERKAKEEAKLAVLLQQKEDFLQDRIQQ